MKSKNILIALLLVITIALAVGLAFLGNKYIRTRNDLNDMITKQEEAKNENREEQNKDDAEESKKEDEFSNVIFNPEKIVNKGEDTYANIFSLGGYRGEFIISDNIAIHKIHLNSAQQETHENKYELEEKVTDFAMANVYPGVAEEYAFVTESGKLYYAINGSAPDYKYETTEITQVSNIVRVGSGEYISDDTNLTLRKGEVLIAIDKDGNCYDVRKLYEEIKQ